MPSAMTRLLAFDAAETFGPALDAGIHAFKALDDANSVELYEYIYVEAAAAFCEASQRMGEPKPNLYVVQLLLSFPALDVGDVGVMPQMMRYSADMTMRELRSPNYAYPLSDLLGKLPLSATGRGVLLALSALDVPQGVKLPPLHQTIMDSAKKDEFRATSGEFPQILAKIKAKSVAGKPGMP